MSLTLCLPGEQQCLPALSSNGSMVFYKCCLHEVFLSTWLAGQ